MTGTAVAVLSTRLHSPLVGDCSWNGEVVGSGLVYMGRFQFQIPTPRQRSLIGAAQRRAGSGRSASVLRIDVVVADDG